MEVTGTVFSSCTICRSWIDVDVVILMRVIVVVLNLSSVTIVVSIVVLSKDTVDIEDSVKRIVVSGKVTTEVVKMTTGTLIS